MHTILSFNSFQQVAIFISFMPLCPQYAHWIILKQVILAVYLKVSQGIFLKYEHSFTCNTTQISLLHLKKKFLKSSYVQASQCSNSQLCHIYFA